MKKLASPAPEGWQSMLLCLLALRGAETTVYLDPFLAHHPARLIPPPFAPEEGPLADLVLCTHEHLDHLDPFSLRGLAQASPKARFVAPLPIVEQVTALGISPERVLGVQPGEELALGALKLFPIPAMHGIKAPPAIYGFDFVEQEGRSFYRYLGYVFELAAAAGVKLLVPIHYEMFAANQGRPGVLVDYVRTHYPALSCYIPAHGRRFTYTKGDLQ